MTDSLKSQIMAGFSADARTEVLAYQDELVGLARGLAAHLKRAGKRRQDVASDPRVVQWAHSLPLETAYAPGALCWLVEEMMDGAVFEVIIADNLPSCKELRARTEMVAA